MSTQSTTPGFTPRVPNFMSKATPQRRQMKPVTNLSSGSPAGSKTSAEQDSEKVSNQLVVHSLPADKDMFACESKSSYTLFVEKCIERFPNFSSPALMCEMLLSELRNSSLSTSLSARAAGAAWCLELLSKESDVLASLKPDLFNALFVDYAGGGGHYNPSAFLCQHISSAKVIKENPYLTLDLYAERSMQRDNEARISREQAVTLQESAMSKRSIFIHTVRKWSNAIVKNCFRGWRSATRQHKIEKFSRASRERRRTEATKLLTIESSFYLWKYTVEKTRSTFLGEKIHSSTFQLENAKNQFQLQCYRSDKYLHTIEDLRKEITELRAERNEFKEETKRQERQLREFKDSAKLELDHHVNVLMHTLTAWKNYSSRLVDEKFIHKSVIADVQQAVDIANVPEMKLRSTENNDSDDSFSEEEDTNEEPQLTTSSQPAKVDIHAEKVLLQWCTSVVTRSVVSQVERVSNFTSDFRSGEVLLLLMHHVYPNDIPYSPLQESNLPKRIERIVELGRHVGMAHLPMPADVLDSAGDIILMAVSELFTRHMQRQSTGDGGVMRTAASRKSSQSIIRYDADTMDAMLESTELEFQRLKELEASIAKQEKQLLTVEEAVSHHAAYLTRERLSGKPVQLVDSNEMRMYCRLKKVRYADIEFKYKGKNDFDPSGAVWHPFNDQLSELQKSLRKHVHSIRRIFKFYAGSDSTMSESSFWRFIGDIRVIEKGFTRTSCERIFSLANADDPTTLNESPEPEYEGEEDPDDEEENPDSELIPSEFVECLIRLSDAKINNKMLHERFEAFMNNTVLPLACKSDADRFRKDIYEPSTQAALQRYQRDLSKAFQHFVKVSVGGSKKTITRNDFVSAMKEGSLITHTFDDEAARNILRHVLPEDTTDLTLHDFIESLVAVCAVKVPSPFIGLDKKVDAILSQFLATLRAKVRIAISDIKPIPLSYVSGGK